MSCYILNAGETGAFNKAWRLVNDFGAVRIDVPDTFEDTPTDKVYVCVIENAFFDAAMVILTPFDLQRAKYERGGRPVTWLVMDRATVRSMVGEEYREEPVLQSDAAV